MSRQYTELYLFLTEQCPNRCAYCYIHFNNSSMTKEDIDRYIALYKPSRVIFFGGEPLVRLDLLEYTVLKYYGQIKFQVVTSTCANFKEFIEFHKEHPLDEVQLSWDGFTDSRVDVNGKSIADKVLKNIYYAIDQGLHFDVKTVINNENIQDLSKIHDLFKEWKNKGLPANGQFVIAHGEDYSDQFYIELEKQLPYTFDLDKMYVEHMNKINAYLNHDYSYASCNIGKYITVNPDGCENICTAMSQYRFNLGPEVSQRRCKHPDCNDCQYSYLCDGGCRYERYLKYREKWQEGHLNCTCRIVAIFAKTIENFLNGLDSEGQKKLLDALIRFKKWNYERYNILQGGKR